MNTGLTTWFRRQSVMALPGALAALALTLPVWRYRVLWHLNVEAIFFELHDVILYLSDLLALLAIALWWLTPYRRRIGRLPRWQVGALAGLALLATLSALWAPLGWLALYQAARLWLLFGSVPGRGDRGRGAACPGVGAADLGGPPGEHRAGAIRTSAHAGPG